MPKLFKRPRSDVYYYRVFKDGKDIWKSTGESDRKKAQAIANGHRAALVGALNTDELFNMLVSRLDELPKEDRDKRRIDYGHRLIRLQGEKLPMAAAWDRWLSMPNKSRFGNPSDNTLAGYTAIWNRFMNWAEKQKIAHLHEVTLVHGQNYMADVLASGVTERTYGAHLKFLRSMFNVLEDQAGIAQNPFAKLTVPELQTQSREAFTAGELKNICAKASGDWKYMIAIGIFTGLRLTDVVHLKWSDITDRITVAPAKVKRRKGSKGKVEIPIHAALARLLDELKAKRGGKPTGDLFPEMVAAYKKSRPSVSKAFCDFLKDDCGITITAEKDDGATRKRRASAKGFHSLRHSFVSLCAASGVPQATTQKLVGHASPAMTQLYSHATAEQERLAINLLPAEFFGTAGK